MTNLNLLWLTPASREFLNNDYLVNGQTPEDRIIEIADTVEKYLAGRPRSRVMRWFTRDRKIDFRERFLHGMSRGWCSLSTPIWTNFGKSRGLPISCYGGFCADTMEGITSHWAEVSIQTANGGGTSGYHGAIRPRGHTIKDNGKSSGPYEFLRIPSALMRVVSQGRARRGNYAAYMPVEHPDILEFLSILDDQSPLNNLFPGVCISDEWFESMLNGDKDKRRVWVTILEYRKTKSKPFLLFSSTVNRNKPDVYKDKNIPIWSSNLCNEILLPSNNEWSFVCDLMSMNALKYDEWKNENFVEIVTIILDAVMQEFIDKARNKKFLEKSVKFAEENRALGIGVFGWHSLLQSKMIPFESMEAKYLNVELFKTIQTQAWAASGKLAEKFGEPAILEGYKRRNTTLTAVAPTTSSSFIIGQPSKSIEPEESNYFMQDLAKIHMPYRNPYLNKVFKEKFGLNGTKIEDAWMSVAHHQGSVQHLSFLTDHEKDVFKTFSEISPKEIIIQAAQRQKWIDQSQSLNLKIHPDSDPRQMHQLIVEGWELGIKTFYYQRSANAAHDSSKDLLQCRNCEA